MNNSPPRTARHYCFSRVENMSARVATYYVEDPPMRCSWRPYSWADNIAELERASSA